jgi:hypothetical protein
MAQAAKPFISISSHYNWLPTSLLDSLDASTVVGLSDRALIATMI